MAQPAHSDNLLSFFAILLSIIIHYSVFSIFTFSFPLKESSLKPQFIFLGSILKTGDMLLPRSATSTSSKFSNKTNPVSTNITSTDEPNNFSAQKPFPGKSVKFPFKRTLRDTAETTVPAPIISINEEKEQALDINEEIAPYQPLRLKSK